MEDMESKPMCGAHMTMTLGTCIVQLGKGLKND